MAISFAESRLAPLVETDPKWKPFGLFARLPPAAEALEEEFAEGASPRFGGRLRRSHSWAGYAAHRAAAGRRAGGQVSSDAAPKKCVQCGDGGESPGSTFDTPSPKTASWASWASECEEDCESELAQLDSPHEPETRMRIPVAGLFVDTPVRAGGAAAGPAAEAASARAEAAAPPAPPKQGPQVVTTLMVQNLKRSLTRQDFMLFLDEQGFAGRYDFVHLPKAFGTVRNNGFAFVNFMKLEDAEEFAGAIARIRGGKMRTRPAEVQGLGANAWKAGSRKMTRIRDSASRPLVVSGHGQGAPSHV